MATETTRTILSRFKKMGVQPALIDGRIHWIPNVELPDDLIADVKANRDALAGVLPVFDREIAELVALVKEVTPGSKFLGIHPKGSIVGPMRPLSKEQEALEQTFTPAPFHCRVCLNDRALCEWCSDMAGKRGISSCGMCKPGPSRGRRYAAKSDAHPTDEAPPEELDKGMDVRSAQFAAAVAKAFEPIIDMPTPPQADYVPSWSREPAKVRYRKTEAGWVPIPGSGTGGRK